MPRPDDSRSCASLRRALLPLAGLLGAALLGAGCRLDDAGGPVGRATALAAPLSADSFEPAVPLDPWAPVATGSAGRGRVVLRLWVDSLGRVAPESVAVAEPSGTPALDRAARLGAAALRYAPALRAGRPVGAALLQPIEFSPRKDTGT